MHAGAGSNDVVAKVLQHFGGRERDQRIVVHKQDHRGAIDLLRLWRRAFGLGDGSRDRQNQCCGSAFSQGARHLQGAAELNGQPMHHGQPKAGAFAQRL